MGVNPDESFKGTYTPLMSACTGNDGYDIAKLLIEHGSNVNQAFAGNSDGSQKGYTPIFFAANLSDIKLVKLLMDNGADVNHQAEDGITPLMRACETSNYKVAKLLIENGSDVNAVDKESKSVLYHACNPKNYYAIYCIVNDLLENGANADYKTNNGETLIDLALRNKSKVKEHRSDYDTFDFGTDVSGFKDNYDKILRVLGK